VDEFILSGIESEITQMPAGDWKQQLAGAPERISRRLDFMSGDHRRVRYFVVEQLPKLGEPIPPSTISAHLRISPGKTARILDDLEKNLFFLVRDQRGSVSWAFPVTVDETPHRLVFHTGERLFAA
jgi:hypothetical protein